MMKKFASILIVVFVGAGVFIVSVLAPPATTPLPSQVIYITPNITPSPFNSFLVATIQLDQYMRAAEATATLRQATLQADYRNVESTAIAATTTASHIATVENQNMRATQAAATATIEAQRTRDHLMLAMTRDAATAEAQAVMAIATATAQAQATSDSFSATRQAIQIEHEEATARREGVVAMVTAVIGVGAAIIVIALVVVFLWRVIPTLVNRAGIVRYGEHQNPLLLTERNGRVIMSDPLAMLQAAMTINENGDVEMAELSPNQLQFLLAGGRMRFLLEQLKYAPNHQLPTPTETTTQRRLGAWESHKTTRYDIPQPPPQTSQNWEMTPPLPPMMDNNHGDSLVVDGVSWQWLTQWQGKGLAIGAGAENGVIAVDLARTPHLFSAGMSGSGKTRRFLRPLVAQAIGQGYFAVLMNESGSDFMPFYENNNVVIIRGNASDYMNIFSMAIDEMTQREQILRKHKVSEWRRLPASVLREKPLMLLAIDELLALAMLLTTSEQREFWGLLAAFASRARKVGMSSVALATDPSYRALGQGGLNYRSQCGRISFRMIQASGSRAILDETGAEQLGDGEFMALLDRPGTITGMAANPSDDELKNYLQRQPSNRLQQPLWLPATTTSNQSTTGVQPPIINLATRGTTANNHPQPVVTKTTSNNQQQPRNSQQPVVVVPIDSTRPPTDEERQFIREIYADLGSKNATCRHVYGFKDGKTYKWIKQAIDEKN